MIETVLPIHQKAPVLQPLQQHIGDKCIGLFPIHFSNLFRLLQHKTHRGCVTGGYTAHGGKGLDIFEALEDGEVRIDSYSSEYKVDKPFSPEIWMVNSMFEKCG
ncbi:hypothetical protein M5E87_16385 [Flavonifractor plautii]|nr:hypothetical protein M5E87_16385 [Flavonifractor plautii]